MSMEFSEISEMQKAEVLIEALPYIQRFNRKIIVVKYGGSAMVDEHLKHQVIQDVVLLKLVGFKPIIVHGGGKEISKWVGKVGMEPHFVNGLRVTDEPTMEIAEMVLNKVNKSLVQLVNELGIKAVGISGKDGMMLKCKKKYSNDEAQEFVSGGSLGGGMLPKLQNCIDAINNGVSRVHILDGRIAHCLLLEIFTNRGIGTAILKHGAERYCYEESGLPKTGFDRKLQEQECQGGK